MDNGNFSILGSQLRRWRATRGLTQPELAKRVGRDQARISELERDLIGGRWGRDRLTLFAEICDALDLVPVLVPRAQASEVEARVAGAPATERGQTPRSAFDELFVDLGDDDEDGR